MTVSHWIAALALGALLLAAPARAEGDADKGAALWPRCRACHMIGEGAQTRAGPHLNGLAGRKAGAIPGFAYSPALARAGALGLVWTPQTLSIYLSEPGRLAPGLVKRAGRIADAGVRADLIAWLLREGGD